MTKVACEAASYYTPCLLQTRCASRGREDDDWDFVIVGTLGTPSFGLQHGKGMLVGVSGCCVVMC
ncbi:MAG: hypothetical protein ACR2H5_20525 [Ktedonobacteraceae bacterium]